jgi:predicted secreted protein
MAKQNGTLYAVFVGATDKILYLTDCSLSLDKNLIPTTNKDSGGWDEHLSGEGLKKWSVPFSGIVDSDLIGGAGMTAEDIMDNIIGNTADANISFTPDALTSGYEGAATFSNCTLSAGTEDAVKFSGTLTGNGPLSKI